MSGSVLVVDDEQGIRDTLVAILEDAGYEALAVPDGQSALNAVRHSPVDVVVMDITMPGLSGLSVLEALGDPPPRVIMMTAHPVTDQQTQLMDERAFAFVRKPFAIPDLLDLVEAGCR